MDYEKSEMIRELKQKKLIEQSGKCASCGKYFVFGEKQELAHIIPQRKWIIAKYGSHIIHHALNMKLTHSGRCNSDVQISPNKTIPLEAHICKIKEAIENDKDN